MGWLSPAKRRRVGPSGSRRLPQSSHGCVTSACRVATVVLLLLYPSVCPLVNSPTRTVKLVSPCCVSDYTTHIAALDKYSRHNDDCSKSPSSRSSRSKKQKQRNCNTTQLALNQGALIGGFEEEHKEWRLFCLTKRITPS